MLQVVSISGASQREWPDSDAQMHHPYFTQNGFFHFVCEAEDTKNSKYQCMLCLPKFHTISTSKMSSSNLRKHLYRVHNLDLKNLEKGAREWRKSGGREMTPQEGVLQIHPSMQVGMTPCSEPSIPRLGVASLATLSESVTALVTDCLLPPSIVESESFKNFINVMQPTMQAPSEGEVLSHLEESCSIMKASIIDKLSSMEYVCLSSNMWRSGCSCYLEINVHWLNPDNLSRHSAVLACRKMLGKPTRSKVAREINDVISEYGIHDKITMIVTDDWSSFEGGFEIPTSSTEDGEEEAENDVMKVTGVDLEAIMSKCPRMIQEVHTTSIESCQIPPHCRCAVRTLNLVAAIDTDVALNDSEYGTIRRAVFTKLQAIWKPPAKTNGNIKEETVFDLPLPKDMGWYSIFNAMDRISSVAKENAEAIHTMCRCQLVPPFSSSEIAFILQYCDVFRPLAIAVDLFQSNEGCCIGYVVPTIRQLLETFDKLITGDEDETPLTTCKPLAEALRDGVSKSFENFLNHQEYLVAAMLVPRFKLLWATGNERISLSQTLKCILREHVMSSTDALSLSLVTYHSSEFFAADNPNQIKGSGFFSFEAKRKKVSSHDPIDWCVENYLKSDCNSLGVYQNANLLKNLYCRYNTSLASPSYAKCACFEPKRYEIEDKHFEMQLMLRHNKKRCEI